MATLKIVHDEDGLNPRKDWDHYSVMACWHRRYTLGDVQPKESPDEWLKENAPEGSIVLPLYLYDHSGITMRTSAFSCPWDSGQVGVIVATPEKIREAFMVKRITKKVRENVTAGLVSDVAVYDMYLRGSVWGFVFEKLLCHHPRHGDKPCDAECDDCQENCGPKHYKEEGDSCWGFIGDDLKDTGIEEYLPDEAKPLLEEAWETRHAS